MPKKIGRLFDYVLSRRFRGSSRFRMMRAQKVRSSGLPVSCHKQAEGVAFEEGYIQLSNAVVILDCGRIS